MADTSDGKTGYLTLCDATLREVDIKVAAKAIREGTYTQKVKVRARNCPNPSTHAFIAAETARLLRRMGADLEGASNSLFLCVAHSRDENNQSFENFLLFGNRCDR